MIINRRYSVKKKISETEANIVYKVKDNESGKIRALKLHKSGASDSIPRFKREYHILQTITHPNIVKVYNFGSFIIGKKEQLYFTMEFVRGIPVNLYFRKGGIKSFVPIFLEILQTMDFIHKKGLLHCDLKPGHILVDKRGDFKIVDFGFALLEETKAGKEIGGTLRYLAPEILKGEDPDVRTEIYTLGIIMYESITGKEVFNENSSSKVIDAIINKPLPEMKKKKVVPEYIHSTIGKMTEKLRINRYASIEEIISALESRGKPVKRKKTIKKLLCSNFVGRKEYLNRVFSLLDESKQGRGKIMLVGGMTGIGKTRLMKEVLFHLLLKGIDTHFYRITPEDHQNFNWLLKLIEKCGGNDKSLKKLASEKQTMGSKEQKYDLFKRIEKELTRIKDNQVHIFILDDIAAEYREIWEFLLYISNFIERKPFFIIGSTEKIPIDWAKLVKDGYEDIEILSLSGLSKDETILLTGNFLSVSRGVDNLASFLYAKTEGNPYFIEEFLGEIVRRGLLHKKNNTLVYRTNEIQKITLPEKIDDFIRNRLSTLTDKENEVLNIISVFRGPVPLLWLNRLLSLKEKDTTIVLEKLYHSKFLTISSRNRCFFTHTIVRDMVYNQMNKRKRDSFHRRIFEFLKSLKQTPQIFKEKSFHAYKAGEAEAKELLTKLLEESIKEDDAESGVDAFHKLKSIYGIEYKEKIPFESVMKVASFYRKLGRFKKSINIYSELLSSSIEGKKRIDILHNLGFIETIMGEYSKAEKIYKQLWAMKPEGDKRFEILLDRGWLYFSEGNYKEAERNYKKALSISTKLKKEYLPGKLYYNLGILEKERENYRKAEGYANKALSIGKKYRNNFYITASLNLLAIIEQGKNNYKKAISYYKETAKLLKKEKNVLRLLNVLVNFSKCYYYSGNIKVCEKNIMESLDLAKKLGKPYEIAYLFNLYGYLMVKKGEFQKAEDYFIRSLNISLSIENYPVQFDNLTELALLSIVQGKDKHIKEYIEKAIKLKKKIKNKRELMKIDLVKEIREYTLGNYKKTIRYAQPIVKTVGDLHIPFYQIPALVYQGLALSKLNKNREATESIKVADNLRKQFGLNLYRYDIKFAKIEIGKQKNNQALINKVSKLLKNRKVKRQAFLYARVLMFFAEIKRKEFRKRRLREPFIESIDSLKKAKELFKKINAKLYIEKVNRKMVDVIDDYTPLERMEKRSEQYLNILEELGDTIGSIDNPEILKKKFITLAKKITGAERGLFLSFIPDENDFVITGKNIDEATIIDARRISRSMVNKAVETKKPVICYDALNDRKFRNNESVMVNEIRSLLCVPIIAEDRVFGTLYLDSRKRPGLFSEKDKEFFNSLSKILSDSLMKAFEFKNIEEETMRLRKRIRTSFGPRSIIGASPKMQEVYGRIEKAASVDIPILILGETGTGKELVANTIHELSSRQDKPFTVVDCLSIPPTLLESELFGYIKGAFTGADREKDGLLESSKEGTIFIDEVGDAILAVQSNLLRFLDTGQIKKIGSTKYKKVDTRVIVATNKNLEKLVEEGNFREDLYYRLKKFVIKLPPLREKKEDIRLLAEHYIKIFNRKYNKNIKGITKDGFEMFYKYDWPGNIREFENEIEMAVISCNRSMIEKNVLSPKISRLKTGFISLREAEALARYNHIRKVLEFTEGNVTRAAEILKIDRKTIQRIMKNHK